MQRVIKYNVTSPVKGNTMGKDLNQTMGVKDVFFKKGTPGLRFEAQGEIWHNGVIMYYYK